LQGAHDVRGQAFEPGDLFRAEVTRRDGAM
jgi:hypothetical protein